MAKKRGEGGAAGRGAAKGKVSRAKVREVVTAIAAEVIAETAQRLRRQHRREALPLRMSTRTQSARKPS
jgi:hypothetical protein